MDYFSFYLMNLVMSQLKNKLLLFCVILTSKGILLNFFGIIYVSDTTVSSLKATIEALFFKHNLSMSRIRGQGYDGTSNM